MSVQNDLLGVLEVEHRGKARRFTSEEQAVAQHLANQIAAALKRSEQQSMQEQLFRTEKLAAAGQVISSVADDLGGPIAAISQLAEALLARQPAPPERAQLEAIQAEVRQASGIVSRLVQLADVEAAEVGQMDLNDLLNGVMALHKRDWAAASLEVENLCSQEPIPVVGSAGQLEQVFSTLLAYAGNLAAESSAKTFTVTSKMLARRAVVEITCPAPGSAGETEDPFSDGETVRAGLLGLGICRSIVRNHGGELRFRRLAPDQPRFEIELPAAPARAEEGPEDEDRATRPGKTLTALVVEPETPVERQLLLLLSQRGHRAVPVSSAEEALDLVQRLRFDLVCCSVRLTGLNWVEFSQRVRHQTGAFVLLTEGFDAELAQALQGDGGYLLSKPVQPTEFERIIGLVEAKA
jgi:CheY-like chemotaxis protein